jgi:hypothetical protein
MKAGALELNQMKNTEHRDCKNQSMDLTGVLKYRCTNERQRRSKGQSRIDNAETRATLGTRHKQDKKQNTEN